MPYNKIYKYLGSNRKKPTSSIYKERKKLLKLKKISPKESPKDSFINFNVTNVFENVEIDGDDDNLDIDMNMNNSFEQTKETFIFKKSVPWRKLLVRYCYFTDF